MERKSSIHLEHNKEVKVGYFFHNSREKITANSIFSTENNFCNVDGKTALENFFKELKKRELSYTKRTNKKLHKNTIRHISAIVNLDKHHTKEDLEKIVKYLEEKFDTKVIQYSIHRDEGHIDEETKKPVINYHGHFEMLGLDSQGNSIRRKFDRKTLIQLQDDIAKILNMQRGINYTKERKKRPKRLNTYEYKEYAKRKARELKSILQENKQLKKENEELKLTKKELLKEISELRKKMIEFNKKLEQKEFIQEDYKYLSTLKKKLKANNLKEIYIKLREFDKSVKERMFKFKKYKEYLEEENKKLKNKLLQSENKVQELEEENKRLKEEIELVKNSLQNEYTKETSEITSKTKKEIDIKTYFVYALSEAQDNFNCNVKLITYDDNEEHNYSTFLPSNIHKITKAIVKNEKYEIVDDLKENKIYVTNLSSNKEDIIEMFLNAINLFIRKGYSLNDIKYHTKSKEKKELFEELKNSLLRQDMKPALQQTQNVKTNFKLKNKKF